MKDLQASHRKSKKLPSLVDLKASLCKASLYHFLLYFWDVTASTPLVDNWHIKAICDKIQPHVLRALRGEKKEGDIIINICPGSTKSTIISHMLPAWCWAVHPESIIISSTGSSSLATKNAMKSRDIIQSEKFKELFPEVMVRKDASAKTFYQNTMNGVRYSYTTKGDPIGQHAHLILQDDPESQADAKSAVKMDQSKEGMKALSGRMIDKKATLRILLMQRLSPIDSTSLALNMYTRPIHICLPAIDSDLVSPPEFREQYIDGLLDPVRLSMEQLEEEKRKLNETDDSENTSEDDYDAQFLQHPQSKKGLVYDLNYYDEEDLNDENAISFGACDVADSGTDHLAAPFAKLVGNKVFIHDVVYTRDGSGITIPLLAQKIEQHDLIRFICEVNNQGSVFVSQLQEKVTGVKGIYSEGNKMNRIISYSNIVNQCFYFKKTGSPEYMKFVKALKGFLKTATKEDDAPDAITILAKYVFDNYRYILK